MNNFHVSRLADSIVRSWLSPQITTTGCGIDRRSLSPECPRDISHPELARERRTQVPRDNYIQARRTLLWLLLFLLTGSLASSQSTLSSLRGVIIDPSGAVVANAQVSLTNEATAVRQTTTSDEKGQYQFPQVAAGTYRVTVRAAGFSDQSKMVELLINQPATVNYELSVQRSMSTITVEAVAQTVNTTDATLGNAVNNPTIQALPMEGRSVPDLLSLQPGVLYLGRQVDQTVDSRSGAVSGARSDQGNVMLDGIDNNDQANGFAFTGVLRSTLDSVEEFRVTTTSSNADAGRSSGAQVSMVTKSGSNQLHGSVYEYNRNTAAVANDWFNKQSEIAAGMPNVPGKLLRNTFGAALGGPIRKNRLFYFFNYEGQRTAENKQETLIVPTASLRAGVLKYPSSGSAVSLTPSQIADMDPNCQNLGTCPWGPGADPNSLTMFSEYPLPNGTAAGDGLNTASFTWSAPNPTSLNTYLGKIDYAISDSTRLFVRGNLQKDRTAAPPQFPSQPPSSTTSNNTKGIAAGLVWSIRPNLIDNIHYGFTRQAYAVRGVGDGPYVDFQYLSSVNAETRNTIAQVPVHNLVDDLTWIKHNHVLQLGGNYRRINNNTSTDRTSYSSALASSYWFNYSGIANTGQSLDPAAFGHPAVDATFSTSYDTAVMALVGLVNQVTNTANYRVSEDRKTGMLLSPGSMIERDFRNNEFEYYVQDSWRVTPSLNLVIGFRHTFLQTPYETHGQQVQPTVDIHQWFETRGQEAARGNTVQPAVSFAPSGQSAGLKPYWPMRKNDFAPRVAIAYSPNMGHGLLHTLFGNSGQTSIRAGFGIYYDHFGQALVNTFNQLGAFSLTSSLENQAGEFTPDTSPRFTGIHDIPQINPPFLASINYPATPSTDPLTSGFQMTYGIDDSLKTPTSTAVNMSVQRELKRGLIFEASYVGRFGRHLIQQLDLAEPLNLVDPKSGVDYFTAAKQLSIAGYAGQTAISPIPYWENMFPWAAGGGNSATQNIYNIWKTLLGNDTFSLYYLDIACYLGCGGYTQPRFWDSQYSSLFAWASDGTSNYNAGQFTLRHSMSQGLQLDLSYTYSKSIDLGSDAERACRGWCGGISSIVNSWNPGTNRGISDFDTTHIITGDWVYALPFGRGALIGKNTNPLVNGIVGGWQFSGLARWTSGLPFSVQNVDNWATNWTYASNLVKTGHVDVAKTYLTNGAPNVFKNPEAIVAGFENGNPLRNAFAGEPGSRNVLRGDGYFGVDAALSKSWHLRERLRLKFAWEVFNVTNSVRFDTRSLQTNIVAGQFGSYSGLLTAPRVQQFSLRLSF